MAQLGSLDMTFNPGEALQGPNVDVRALALHDGGILVGGDFHHFQQLPDPKAVDGIIGWQSYSILKLNREGSVDASFNAGVGANGPVYALAPTGEPTLVPHTIYLGGEFSRMNGVPRNGVARLLSNGFLDTAFRPINVEDDIVYTLAFHPYANYGQILVGGELCGTGARGVLRLLTASRAKGWHVSKPTAPWTLLFSRGRAPRMVMFMSWPSMPLARS